MFVGEYHHAIDAKRRVAVPAKFRKKLGRQVVAAKGLEGSVAIYPQKEWEELGEKLAKLPMGKTENRSFVRMILAGAYEGGIDSLGRILLPEHLTQHADLKKDVVIVGLFSKFELWNKERWEEYKKKTEKHTGDIAEKLGEMGVF